MTEKMTQLMKDVPAVRWTALVLLASAMFFGYIFMDILSPLQELLQHLVHFVLNYQKDP